MTQYNYINQGGMYEAGNKDDAKQYQKVNNDFEKMGFSPEQSKGIWRIVAAVILIGQITFKGYIN